MVASNSMQLSVTHYTLPIMIVYGILNQSEFHSELDTRTSIPSTVVRSLRTLQCILGLKLFVIKSPLLLIR